MNSGSKQPSTLDIASLDSIQLTGVCTNNLKGIDVRIPHNQITVLTGPSGCGKSSLAFDTIYAEAKRQFLDSLSFQARQALQYLPRPQISHAEGLLPVVCIRQLESTPHSRSTVATVTGIHDFLRLLMTRIGEVRCSKCNRVIDQTSTDQIEQFIISLPQRTRVMILAPVKGEFDSMDEQVQEIRKAGFVRVRTVDDVVDLEAIDSNQIKTQKLDAVVDRIIVKPGIEDRIGESVTHALKFGEGSLYILTQEPETESWTEKPFSTLYACPDCGNSYEEIETRTFSYFSPFGICVQCEGAGTLERFSQHKIFHGKRNSIETLDVFQLLPESVRKERLKELEPILSLCKVSPSDSIEQLDSATAKILFEGNQDHLGLQNVLEKVFVTTTNSKTLESFKEFRDQVPCLSCNGSRLCTAANHVFVADENIGQIVRKSISASIDFVNRIPNSLDEEQREIAKPILKEILNRLQFLNDVGVGYLNLDRRAETLSGGEFQRVRLATGLGNRLTDVCYILDEPTTGLHPADSQRLLETIGEAKHLGNTVIVVEHDAAAMEIADHLIELGPGAGESGGKIRATGTYQEFLRAPDSLTAEFLRGDRSIRKSKTRELPKEENSWITIEGAKLNNLKGDSFRFPFERLTCVTGVSGSGKSSMVSGVLVPVIRNAVLRNSFNGSESSDSENGIRNGQLIQKVVSIDQSPIGRSPRSNAATFTGLFDEIRKVFAQTKLAKRLGMNASHFSFNNKQGACPSCHGQGQLNVEMRFMPDVQTICQTCMGKRFSSKTLAVQFKGKNIADILNLQVSDAIEFFENINRIKQILIALEQVGLGYLKLGQPATTLSGGESQRLKIANQLSNPDSQPSLFVLDEPTSGLHFAEIERIHGVLQEIVDQGHTVVLVEHHLDLIKNADYVIDFGPEGGVNGGKIIFAGTPQQLSRHPTSLTGQFLSSCFAADDD